MTTNRVLIVAVALVASTVLFYLAVPHHQSRQPRVYLTEIPNEPDEVVAQAKKYLREACPDMVLIKDEPRADYKMTAAWAGDPTYKKDSGNGWVVFVDRKNSVQIFGKQGSPDAIETFRQSCASIRDDAKELADFNAHTPAMPIGRYSLHSVNPDRVFLLDTKTGGVWELEPLGRYQVFERVSVEGLYSNMPPGVRP